ncbi:hypothetical protein [Nitrobacter sp. 62-13]|uniref:hypothetical protein n=1 Tax=Nitrobacter sp. 62-13 TaxID=1895797 RepID=UPI0025E7B209|nr:hypothetical protein [Nitrobacter sp. 62-13]
MGFVGGEAVNIAVLERSFRKRDLLGIGIHQQCAFDKDKLIVSAKIHAIPKFERFCVKRLP